MLYIQSHLCVNRAKLTNNVTCIVLLSPWLALSLLVASILDIHTHTSAHAYSWILPPFQILDIYSFCYTLGYKKVKNVL